MKILIISRNAWRNENSTGNTLNNLFSNFNGEVSNIFCRAEIPNTKYCNKYYRITDKDNLKGIFHKNHCGTKYEKISNNMEKIALESVRNEKIYSIAKIKKIYLLYWIRECLWGLGNWKNQELNNFLNEVNPDIIYMHIFDSFYMHKILYYVASKTNAKVVLYTGDDYLTMNQFSISPFYWINRLILRKYVKRSINLSALTYCMTPLQIEKYKEIMGKDFVLLNKGNIITKNQYVENEKLNILFTGNLEPNRWKVLCKLGKYLDKFNERAEGIKLNIYTPTKISSKIEKKFNNCSSIYFGGTLSSKDTEEKQKNADILLHVESFEKADTKKVMMSLSTKIIDYLGKNKCILAIGPANIASMDFLIKNNLAYTITDLGKISALNDVLSNYELRKKYAKMALSFSEKNLNLHEIQNKFYSDLNNLLIESNK